MQRAAFCRLQLHRHPEAVEYLQQRGLQDPDLIEELGIGYAPGGNLRRRLADLGYSFALLRRTGLINHQGRDAFCRRVMFPCRQQGRVINLYGRSIGTAFPHRLLPRSKGGLFAWESVRAFSTVILVEGLFDLAVLRQADFRNVTCAFGTHLTPAQLSQLCEPPGRCIYISPSTTIRTKLANKLLASSHGFAAPAPSIFSSKNEPGEPISDMRVSFL